MSLSTDSEQYISVTWFGSRIVQVHLFYEKLKALVPKGTLVYGAQVDARMEDGLARYHAVVVFDRPMIWAGNDTTLKMFTMTFQLTDQKTGEDVDILDTDMITYRSPKRRSQDGGYVDLKKWLNDVQDYIEEGGVEFVFGERIRVEGVEEDVSFMVLSF
jgi:hypothetical protein